MKNPIKKTGEKKEPEEGPTGREALKTDLPLSEKDEVKQAEEKMRKRAKKS